MAPLLNFCLFFTLLITTTLCMFDIRVAATQTRGAFTSFSRRQLAPLLASVDNNLSELVGPVQSDVAPVLSGVGTAVNEAATTVQNLIHPVVTNAGNVVGGIVTPITGVVGGIVTPITSVVGEIVTPLVSVVGAVNSDLRNVPGEVESLVQSPAPIIAPSPSPTNQTNDPSENTTNEAPSNATSTSTGYPTAPPESSSLSSARSTTGINSATTLEPGPLTASSTQSQHGDPRTSVSEPLAALSATSQTLSTAMTADMSSPATITASKEESKLQAPSKLGFNSGLTATRSELHNSLITAVSAPTAALTAFTTSAHVSDLVTSISGHLTTIPVFSEAVSTKTIPPYTVLTTSGTTYTFSIEASTTSISTSTPASPSAVDGAGTGTVNGGGQGTSSASSTSTPGVYDGMITLPNGVKVPLAAVVAPVVIGFALASALAFFCFWRRRKLREAIDDDDDREGLHPTSNTSSGFFSSRWSLSTFRDIEAASQRHSNYSESHNDHDPEYEEQSCLAPVERFVRHIFELDASEPAPQELEAVERVQELETTERPQGLEAEDNNDPRGCAASIQRLLRQMLGQPTRQCRETLDMNLVEEIDFIEELRAHNELRQTHYHEKSADLKSPAKAYLRQDHTPTEEEFDPPPRYED